MPRRTPWERRQAELAKAGIVANLYTVDRRTRAAGVWLLTLKAGDVVHNRELRARLDDKAAAELEALELTILSSTQPSERQPTMSTLTTRIAAGLAGLTVAATAGVMAHRPPVVTVAATPASSTQAVAVEELTPAELNAYTVDLPAAAPAPAATTAPVPAQPAPAAPKPAPRVTWATPAHDGVPIPQTADDEQVWYRNPDGYCGSTNRANLGDRTPDPTCPDNKPATYSDPATEDQPVYVMGGDGFCSGMAQRDAAAAGYPDGDPRCTQGGYGSTPQPSGQ